MFVSLILQSDHSRQTFSSFLALLKSYRKGICRFLIITAELVVYLLKMNSLCDVMWWGHGREVDYTITIFGPQKYHKAFETSIEVSPLPDSNSQACQIKWLRMFFASFQAPSFASFWVNQFFLYFLLYWSPLKRTYRYNFYSGWEEVFCPFLPFLGGPLPRTNLFFTYHNLHA